MAPDVHPWERASQPAQKQVRFSARFVKESFPDKHEIICGDVFCKSWWMRNDGETAWPAGTQLIQTSGDDINAQIATLKNELPAGETFEFSVQCKAPAKEGRYNAFFRLQTGRIKFGHKVSCDILCVKPVEQSSFEEQPKIAEPVEMVSQEVVADKEIKLEDDEKKFNEPALQQSQVDEKMAEPVASPLDQSTISINAKSPKQVYFEHVEAEECEILKSQLTALYDFGFTNFNMNKMLMLKHNNVNIVAETLMSGALSESQLDIVMEH